MAERNEERRHSSRTDLKQVVRIRPFDPQLPPEYCTTLNLSADGLYFTTAAAHYSVGTNVYVTGDFQPGSPIHRAVAGVIVRVDRVPDERFGIAIQIIAGT